MNAVLEEPEITPSSAIAALLMHSGPVVVDLDETIYLRNSTEDFIDSARPSLLALFAMRFLDAVRPWRWTGGESTRDVWRVRCINLLFPWTKKRWERRVKSLAGNAANAPLVAAIQKRSQLPNFQPAVIATLGFESVVTPLVAALGLPRVRVIAARSDTFADRRGGKLRMVANRIGHEAVRRSLVMTDSKEDEPLLDACAIPLRIEWPDAKFRPALSGQYFPGQYLTLVKRPGERYIARGILQEDFALWVLASISLAAQPVVHVVGLLFLLLSFWSVYESGYVDNDRSAARYERDPKLSGTFGRTAVATPAVKPWIWALISGAVGCLVLRGFGSSAAYGFAAWIAVLAVTYGAFAHYNRLDKTTRIWWYCGLQLTRSAPFAVLVPIHPIGALAIGAHVAAKWVPYYMYRLGGKNWPESSHFLPRLLFFVLFTGLLAVANGIESIWTWPAAVLLAWNLYRARHELLDIFVSASRIDKEREPTLERKRSP